MFNTTAYGKAVVKYIQAVKYFQFFRGLDFWSCGNCSFAYFTILIIAFWKQYIFGNLLFADFRVPQPFAAVSQLPAALRLPQKKHTPGILEHVSCGCCQFLSILGSRAVVR